MDLSKPPVAVDFDAPSVEALKMELVAYVAIVRSFALFFLSFS